MISSGQFNCSFSKVQTSFFLHKMTMYQEFIWLTAVLLGPSPEGLEVKVHWIALQQPGFGTRSLLCQQPCWGRGSERRPRMTYNYNMIDYALRPEQTKTGSRRSLRGNLSLKKTSLKKSNPALGKHHNLNLCCFECSTDQFWICNVNWIFLYWFIVTQYKTVIENRNGEN